MISLYYGLCQCSPALEMASHFPGNANWMKIQNWAVVGKIIQYFYRNKIKTCTNKNSKPFVLSITKLAWCSLKQGTAYEDQDQIKPTEEYLIALSNYAFLRQQKIFGASKLNKNLF